MRVLLARRVLLVTELVLGKRKLPQVVRLVKRSKLLVARLVNKSRLPVVKRLLKRAKPPLVKRPLNKSRLLLRRALPQRRAKQLLVKRPKQATERRTLLPPLSMLRHHASVSYSIPMLCRRGV